jgi:hypothetical protein
MRDEAETVLASSTPPNTSSKKLFTVRFDTVDGVGTEDGVLLFGSTSGVRFKDFTPRPDPAGGGGGAGIGVEDGEDSGSSSHARKSEWSAFDGFEVCSTDTAAEEDAAAGTGGGELMSNSSKGSGFVLTTSVVLILAGVGEIMLANNVSMLSSNDDDVVGVTVVNGPVGCVEVTDSADGAAAGDVLSRNQSSKSSMKMR